MDNPKAPTYEDAQLILRLYELRRDDKLRSARDWFTFRFNPQSFDDIAAVASSRTQENDYYRMVTSYWDMASSFATHGILNADFLLENNGELLIVWAKLEPFIDQIRETSGFPNYMSNIESVVKSVDWAPERLTTLRARIKAMSQKAAADEKA